MNQVKPQISSSLPHPVKKMKPIFNRHTEWRCMKPSDISSINIHRPKMTQSVTITKLSSETLGAGGLRNLRKTFKDLKTIHSVVFDGSSINTKQLIYLLSSANHLKHLYFQSPESTDKLSQELTRISSRLSRYKRLNTFPLFSQSAQQTPNQKILKKLNKLERLDLNFPLHNNPSLVNPRPPRSLTNLRLRFKNNPLVPPKQLSAFVKSLRRCHLLEQLSLSFSDDYQIQLSDAQIWASFFKGVSHLLKKLCLFLDFSSDQKPKGLQVFIKSLQHLKNLTSFRLASFAPFQPLTSLEDFLPLVFKSLQSLTQLKALELAFDYFKFESRDIHCFASMLQSLKNLVNLDISFPPLSYPDQDLIPIAESLGNLKKLEILHLRVNNDFSKKSMQILLNNIFYLNLTSLHLGLGRLFIPQKTLRASTTKVELRKLICFLGQKKVHPTSFFLDLQSFTQLSTLQLQLSSFELSNQELINLSLALQKFSQLSSLTLTLPQINSNSFQGFNEVFSCLKDLPKLTELFLWFEGDRISNRQVEILSSNLAGCQSLSDISLHFSKAASLKDKTLYSLLSAIRALCKLKCLFLLFDREKAFGKKAESHFLEGLLTLKDLSRFYFIYDAISLFRNNKVPLPPNLEGYANLRNMKDLVFVDSRYI